MSYLFDRDITVYIQDFIGSLSNLWLLTNKTYIFAVPYNFKDDTSEYQIINKVKSIFEQIIKCLQNKNNLLYLDLIDLLDGYYIHYNKCLLENNEIMDTFNLLIDELKKSSKFRVLVIHPCVNTILIDEIKTKIKDSSIYITTENQSRLKNIGYSFNDTSEHIIDCLIRFFKDANYTEIIYQMTHFDYGKPYRYCDK